MRAKPQRERRKTTAGASKRRSRPTTAGASKRKGICAKPRRERRNAREFARNHGRSVEIARNHSGSVETQGNSRETTGGSVETQGNSRETTAGASKRRSRPTACAVAARNLSGPPEEARRGQRRPEFARNHSGSVEMQGNSRETTAGASQRNGILAKPQRERGNEGRAPPPRAPLRPATNSVTLNVRTPQCKHCLGKKASQQM